MSESLAVKARSVLYEADERGSGNVLLYAACYMSGQFGSELSSEWHQ